MRAHYRRGARRVWLCYVDESGDPGYELSGTHAYSLGVVLVHDSAWLAALDDLVRFRRFLRREFGIPPRLELKTKVLLHNSGKIRSLKLGDVVREKIIRMHLRLLGKLADGQGIRVFGVVADKDELETEIPREDPQRAVWERVLERLERFTYYEKDTCIVIPDEGGGALIQSIVREKRRFSFVPSRFGTAPLSRPAAFVLEDPVLRKSHESYFVQLADFVAFAAHRAIKPTLAYGAQNWDLLGEVREANVNKYSKRPSPTGLVLWPPVRKGKASGLTEAEGNT